MKKGPKAEPSGTVVRMEEWTEGGTFGNGGADGGWTEGGTFGNGGSDGGIGRRRNLRGRWREWRRGL